MTHVHQIDYFDAPVVNGLSHLRVWGLSKSDLLYLYSLYSNPERLKIVRFDTQTKSENTLYEWRQRWRFESIATITLGTSMASIWLKSGDERGAIVNYWHDYYEARQVRRGAMSKSLMAWTKPQVTSLAEMS